jgi:hypothetical protein
MPNSNRLLPIFRVLNPGHETGAAPALTADTAPDRAVRTLTTLVDPTFQHKMVMAVAGRPRGQ